MREYTPDNWNLVRIELEGEWLLKLFTGNHGGFAGSDTWKLSSKVNKIIKHADHYEFNCESGSTYRVGFHTRMSSYMLGIYANWKSGETDDFKIDTVDVEDYLECL